MNQIEKFIRKSGVNIKGISKKYSSIEEGVKKAVEFFNSNGFTTEWSGEYSDGYVFHRKGKNRSFIAFKKPLPDNIASVISEIITVKKENKLITCFETFWKNWIHCKRQIGLIGNYGSKSEALSKWKKVIKKKDDIETLADKMIDFMIMVYSDIAESKEQHRQPTYFNFENMYPQKFIERAYEVATNE